MPTTSPVPLDNFVGAGLIGLVLSTVIYGITCLQTYLYYERYCGKDRWLMKTIVGTLWFLDSFHVALITMMVYHYTVTNWGDLEALGRTTWSLEIGICVGTMVTFTTQSFFAHRIYRLSDGNWLLTGFIVICSLIQVGFGTAFMVHGFETVYWSTTGLKVNKIILGVALAGDISCDLGITISMCYYLRRARTGFRGTNRMIDLLTTYTIRTCLLTTICTVSTLITFMIVPTTMVSNSIFYSMAVRLYSNSLLSTLNNRQDILEQSMPRNSDIMTLSNITGSEPYSGNGNSKGTIVFARRPSDSKWNEDEVIDVGRIQLGRDDLYDERSKV